jgi:hypothetical protein
LALRAESSRFRDLDRDLLDLPRSGIRRRDNDDDDDDDDDDDNDDDDDDDDERLFPVTLAHVRRRGMSRRGRYRDNNIDITSLDARYFVSSATPVLAVFLRTPGES